MATVTIVLDHTDIENITEYIKESSPKELLEILIAALKDGDEG
ncbi:MAG: hypothetical protein ACPHQD_04745 [Vibrio toranzoniae]|jgi:hypothetical protein